jgi:hypothetical protein
MTESDKVKEWAAFYRASPQRYNMNALLAVYENEGEKILSRVLAELGLARSVDLVKDAAKNDR